MELWGWETWSGLAGVFLGGAFPWLEAVVVIPAGIAVGLPAMPVVFAAMVGNLLTVGVAAYGGDWLKAKWEAWRQRRREAKGEPEDSETAARRSERAKKQKVRIDRIMNRGGTPLLAVVAPLGLGTQLAALAIVAAGARPTPTFIWVGIMTVLWGVLAAVATVTGLDLLGIR